MITNFYRDIKGANLLVDAYGVVKLADFGMAKHVSYKPSVCKTFIISTEQYQNDWFTNCLVRPFINTKYIWSFMIYSPWSTFTFGFCCFIIFFISWIQFLVVIYWRQKDFSFFSNKKENGLEDMERKEMNMEIENLVSRRERINHLLFFQKPSLSCEKQMELKSIRSISDEITQNSLNVLNNIKLIEKRRMYS